MIASDDCSEPDPKDLAWEPGKEREFESLRLEYKDVDRKLRDYRRPDRQLRALSYRAKAISSELWRKYRFVAEADYFGTETPPAYVPTRKDKRRIKTERRRGGRYLWRLGILT